MMESVLQEWHNLHMTDLNEIAVFFSVAQLSVFKWDPNIGREGLDSIKS
jgi:hypothetical protein